MNKIFPMVLAAVCIIMLLLSVDVNPLNAQNYKDDRTDGKFDLEQVAFIPQTAPVRRAVPRIPANTEDEQPNQPPTTQQPSVQTPPQQNKPPVEDEEKGKYDKNDDEEKSSKNNEDDDDKDSDRNRVKNNKGKSNRRWGKSGWNSGSRYRR
jgi:hypothetical protein